MTQKTFLAEMIAATEEMAGLDEACKQLLANRIVLAWIMKYTMDEYRDYDVGEIAERYIEVDTQQPQVAVHRNTRNIHGEDTVDKTIEEGTVYFDIRFRALLPDSGEFIVLLVNVEAQNDFYPGYPLVKRGVYYCCRMISGQYGTEFTNSHYDDIKKVYSIWICMNPPEKYQHSITKYNMVETNIAGKYQEKVKNYDLLTIVMLCLGEVDEHGECDLTNMLSVLLSNELDAKKKTEILTRDYGMVMTEELEEEVLRMCNYSKGVAEKGIQQGIQEGILQTLCSLVKDGLLKSEEAAKRMNVTEEVFLRKMKDAGF